MPLFSILGFSLIELLMALTIITAIMAISIPSLTAVWQHSKEQILSDQLLRALNLARSEAIMRHASVLLSPAQTEWQQGFLIHAADDVIYTFSPPVLAGKLFWRAFPAHRTEITFLPTGFTQAENGTFWYCPQRAIYPSWAIMLVQSGRARMAYPSAAGKIWDSHHKVLEC